MKKLPPLKPLTAHQLAKELLECEDLPVYFLADLGNRDVEHQKVISVNLGEDYVFLD